MSIPHNSDFHHGLLVPDYPASKLLLAASAQASPGPPRPDHLDVGRVSLATSLNDVLRSGRLRSPGAVVLRGGRLAELRPRRRSRVTSSAQIDRVGFRPGPSILGGPRIGLARAEQAVGPTNLRALAQIRGETGSLETAPSATQSCRCSHSGIASGSPPFSRCILGAFGGHGKSAGETRGGRGEVACRVSQIVSQAGFRGPGWALSGHPPTHGGPRIGGPGARPNAVARSV